MKKKKKSIEKNWEKCFFLVVFTPPHILVAIQSAQGSDSDSIGKREVSAHFLSKIFYWNYFSGNSWMWQHLKKNKLNCSKSQQVLKANEMPEEKDTLKCHVQFFHVLKTKEKNIIGICSKQSPGYRFTSVGPSKITLSTKHLTVGKIEEGKNNFKYSNASVRTFCWNLTLEPLGINLV